MTVLIGDKMSSYLFQRNFENHDWMQYKNEHFSLALVILTDSMIH